MLCRTTVISTFLAASGIFGSAYAATSDASDCDSAASQHQQSSSGANDVVGILNDVHSNSCMDESSIWLAEDAQSPLSKLSANLVEFEWMTVDNPGNAADVTTGYGAVEKTFLLAKYEVTNEQYA